MENNELSDGLIENKAYVARMRRLLESNDMKQKYTAMSELMKKISDGVDVSDFFPYVVKNIIVDSLDVKKLVYTYLIHFAEKKPEIALLSINSFQNGMKDSNQMVRAMNLRVMSSIRIKMIVPLILLAVRKCVSDPSAYVRKIAALALMKVYALEKDRQEESIGLLKTLLADKNNLVLGTSIIAYEEICPDHWELIHPHFRRICNVVADLEEWAQIVACQMMLRYARAHLGRPTDYGTTDAPLPLSDSRGPVTGHGGNSFNTMPESPVNPTGLVPGNISMDLDKFYDDDDEHEAEEKASSESEQEPDSIPDEEDNGEINVQKSWEAVGNDHRLMLRGTESLLRSRNSAVILSVAVLHLYTAPKQEVGKVVNALLLLIKSSREISYVILSNIVSMSESYPTVFHPFIREFFSGVRDPVFIKTMKISILTNLVTSENINLVLEELNNSINSTEKAIASAAIRAVGQAAVRLPSVADRCLLTLTELIKKSKSKEVVAECVIVMKKLMQVLNASSGQIFREKMKDLAVRLIHVLESVEDPDARASTIWVLGEYGRLIPHLAPDVLRVLAKGFMEEKPFAKLQILIMAVKLYLGMKEENETSGIGTSTRELEKVGLLLKYIITLCKYDVVYDIRDRSRLISKLIFSDGVEEFEASAGSLLQKAGEIFLSGKPAPTMETTTGGITAYTLGSLSHVVKQVVAGYTPLMDFPDVPSPPTLRDPVPSPAVSDAGGDRFEKYGDIDEESGSESETGSSYGSYSSGESYTSSSYSSGSESESEDEQPVERKEEPVVDSDRHGLNLLDFTVGGESNETLAADILIEKREETAQVYPVRQIEPNMPIQSNVMANASADSMESHELLNHAIGRGLEISYSISRTPTRLLANALMLRLTLRNKSSYEIREVGCDFSDSDLASRGIEVIPFQKIDIINPRGVVETTLNVKFVDKSQTLRFNIVTKDGEYPVKIRPTLGEVFVPYPITWEIFEKKMRSTRSGLPSDVIVIRSDESIDYFAMLVMKHFNLFEVDTPDDKRATQCHFSGKLLMSRPEDLSDGILYLRVEKDDEDKTCRISAYSEDELLCGRALQNSKQLMESGNVPV